MTFLPQSPNVHPDRLKRSKCEAREDRRAETYAEVRCSEPGSATKQMVFFIGLDSGMLILGEPLRWQLSSQALLSRKLVHSRGGCRELKSQSQMIEHASYVGVLIPAFDFARNYF